jgi:predicted metal-dependent TIM-barrel fold hydrolase
MFPKGLGVFMANRWLNQFITTRKKGIVLEAGAISLSSAGAVVSSTLSDLIASVTHSNTGEYTVVLADKWVGCQSVLLTVESSLATVDAFVGSVDVTSTKTIVLNTSVSSVKADVTAASKIHVLIVLKNSTAR